MPVATPISASPHPSSLVKMEERKRPAITSADDLAPPSKRQAVNGGSGKSKDDGADNREEAWIEDYQKDAILRQMQEYKRDKSTLELRLEELEKRSAYHDDHVRIIEAWVLQLVQEIELLCQGTVSLDPNLPESPFPSALEFKDSKEFQRHLGDTAMSLKARIDGLFRRLSVCRGQVKPEVSELETQVKSLLAAQKEYMVRIDRLSSEKDIISEQLDAATLRYIKAEKKLDRAKSAQVQRLEQQALANATARPVPAADDNDADVAEANANLEALRAQFQEAMAVVAKHKEQLETAFSEIKALQDENSTFKARRETLSDDDYARTDVFKQFKMQNEDLIRRINHLEAINKQLREEAERLQGERSAFRSQLELEAQAYTGELEDQIQQKEQDLTRIRSARDELLADVQIRKAAQELERTAHVHMRELDGTKDDRIAALESELERLRPGGDAAATSTPREDLEALSADELRERYARLEKDFGLIQQEVPSVEKAYKRAIIMAQTRVMAFAALEDKAALLTLEKAKADQKYFAARKDMDIRIGEIRALRHQNGKSSEIIAALKDAEAQNRTLMSNLEKQMADFHQSNTAILDENRALKQAHAEAVRRYEMCKAQIADLSAFLKAKDASYADVKEHHASQEVECERLKVRLDLAQKDRDNWKSKCLANSSEEEEMLRNFALCPICRNTFKNSIIKTCGHVFCQGCLEARLANRMRKCPTCSKAFDKMDVMAAHL